MDGGTVPSFRWEAIRITLGPVYLLVGLAVVYWQKDTVLVALERV